MECVVLDQADSIEAYCELAQEVSNARQCISRSGVADPFTKGGGLD